MSAAAGAEESEPVLVMSGITKDFPGVRALDGAELVLDPGEVHVLLGENGAGKSTLMKVLAGIQRADAGSLRLAGRELVVESPQHARELGVSMIHQEFFLVPELSVAENLFLGREPLVASIGPLRIVDHDAMVTRARGLLGRVGLARPPTIPAGELKVAEQQLVEIAKALADECRILIMDEPTAALAEGEIAGLFGIIRELTSQGVAVVYISHRMEELFEIGDRVTVMRDGAYVGTRRLDEISMDDLVEMMVGRKLAGGIPKKEVELGEELLRVEGLCGDNGVQEVSFAVRAGEVVGLAGLMGAGRTEVLRLIFGADRITGGEVLVEGRRLRPGSPRDAIEAGVGLVTEDRKRQGLVLDLSVADNAGMATLAREARRGVVQEQEFRDRAAQGVEKLRIRTPGVDQRVGNLSGGNQQKVVLAKWLRAGSRVLLIDEPTRGIDIGAKNEIYELIGELVEQGDAVVVVSSEMSELLGLADRILVLHEGRVTAEFQRGEASQEAILHAALGEPITEESGEP